MRAKGAQEVVQEVAHAVILEARDAEDVEMEIEGDVQLEDVEAVAVTHPVVIHRDVIHRDGNIQDVIPQEEAHQEEATPDEAEVGVDAEAHALITTPETQERGLQLRVAL